MVEILAAVEWFNPREKGKRMTRKHYEQIAKMIRQERQNDDGRSAGTIASIADSLACICEADNPRFNRGTFFTACGMDEDGLEWVI
jgi:hypothetical protein